MVVDSTRVLTALGLGAAALGLAIPACGHGVLSPELAQNMLIGIAQLQHEANAPASLKLRAHANCQLGEKVEQLVEVLNQDAPAHGGSDPLVDLLLKRLEGYQVSIAFFAGERKYAYDMTAWRTCVKLDPSGVEASNARYKLIAQRYYAMLASDPGVLKNTNVAGVLEAIGDQESFLKDYPRHPKSTALHFFLGINHYRLVRNPNDSVRVREHQARAQAYFLQVVADAPKSVEARAASVLLEKLRGAH